MAYFLNLLTFVPDPKAVPAIIEAEPFDYLFLALAYENGATLIVSGDRHLLDPESFNNIQIVTPSEGVQIITRLQHTTPVPSVLSNCASAMPKRSLETS